MALFNRGDFQLSSGRVSTWIIDCETLTGEDWDTLAFLASCILPSFDYVTGIERGGVAFARALHAYRAPYRCDRIVIADDVVTTGKSFKWTRAKLVDQKPNLDIIGIAVFDRSGGCKPDFVKALLTVNVA
jgi:orotate phosphoribosyltransferase